MQHLRLLSRTAWHRLVVGVLVGIWVLSFIPGCSTPGDTASVNADAPDSLIQSASPDSTQQTIADAGSLQETGDDSVLAAAPDTTDQKSAKKKRGLFSRLFHRDAEKDSTDEEEEQVPVELAIVEISNIPSYLGATATLEPDKQAAILAKINGEIRELLTEEGDQVREGQVLAILDGAVQRVGLEEASARLHALELDVERVRALHEQQLASAKDLQEAQSQFEQAEALRKGADLQVEYTRIVAPFSGQISERFVDPGQTVAPGTELFSIVDSDPLLARIYLPEREAMKIAPGQEVVITPDTNSQLHLPGRVLRIAPVVDGRTGTVKVTCHLSGGNPSLRPGSFVRVQLETDVHRDVLAIPKRALVPEGAESYVFMAVADSVVKSRIETGYANDILIEVTDGLREGDRVVTVGQGALKTGSRVREIQREPVSIADADSGRRQEM